MDATLWRMRERPTVEDEDGNRPATDADLLNMGVKPVGIAPNGDTLIHAAPDTDLSPPEFTNVFNPGWSWEDVPQKVREHVLEASWEEEVDGETVRRRRKIRDVPSGATVVESDLPPHHWFGDREAA